MEEMISECCEAPIFRYEKAWDAGICWECKTLNSVKRVKKSPIGIGFDHKNKKFKKEEVE